MVIRHWLASFNFRLTVSRKTCRLRRRRPRRFVQSAIPAMVEVVEAKQLLTATAVSDSYQVNPMAGTVTLDVLANDSSTAGSLHITSFGSVPYGSITKLSANPYGSPSHDELSFTPQAGYNGTESFTYTVTDSANSQ